MNDHHQRLTVADLLAERAATATQRRAPVSPAPRRTIAPAPRRDSADVIDRIDAATPARVAQLARERLQAQLVRERLLAQRFHVPQQSRKEPRSEAAGSSPVQWIDPLPPTKPTERVKPSEDARAAERATPTGRATSTEQARPAGRTKPSNSIMQPIAGAVAGAAVWTGMHWLWAHQPAIAFLAAMIAVATTMSVTRKFDDRCSAVVAVLVGLIVTVSPAALVLLSH